MRTRGYIDGIFGAAVRGWVVDLDDPGNVLHVVVRLDGQPFAAVAADEPRADLAKAGIGNGVGGFRVPIGTPPVAGSHEIVAVVAGSTTTVPLAQDVRLLDASGAPRSDIQLYEGGPPPPPPPPPPGTEPEPSAAAAPPPLTAAAAAADGPAGPPAPSPEAALAGEAGWLFRCPEPTFDLIRGVADADGAALDRLAAAVAAFGTAVGSRGVVCLTAVVPDKLHVYPEHAPATMALYPAGRVAEHLAARLQDTDDGLLLDLLPALLRARVHGRVFSRAGTGPTWLGAFHAYRAVAKLLAIAAPALRPRAAGTLLLGDDEPVADAPGDGPLLRWHGHALVPDGSAAGLAATATEASLSPAFPRDASGADADLPRAVIVHDGPSRRVAELLADHCRATLVAADLPDPELVGDHDPSLYVWLAGDGTLARLARTA